MPHSDSRVEAEFQRILSLRRSAGRIEDRLEDVIRAQTTLDGERRRHAGSSLTTVANLTAQATELREERRELESSIGALHDEISERLADLGDDALLLNGDWS